MASKYMQKFPIPDQFPDILHDFTREILRFQPRDIIAYAVKYFEALANNEDPCQIQGLEQTQKAISKTESKQNEKSQQNPNPKLQEKEKSNPPSINSKTQSEKPKTPIGSSSYQKANEQENENEKPKTPASHYTGASRPDSSNSKATSHKTEKQLSQIYMSKLYTDIAQNNSEQRSQSMAKDQSQAFSCGTLWAVIHSFTPIEKFTEPEKLYILAFPTTNQQQIYKTQEVQNTDIFEFESSCHFYFNLNQSEDIEMDEPQIIFQVYKMDSVKETLGQAMCSMATFTSKNLQNEELVLLDQNGSPTGAKIMVTLDWKSEEKANLDQSEEQPQTEKNQEDQQVNQNAEESQDQTEQIEGQQEEEVEQGDFQEKSNSQIANESQEVVIQQEEESQQEK